MMHLYLKSILFTFLFACFLQPGFAVNSVVQDVDTHENVVSKKEHKKEVKSKVKQLKKEWKQQKRDAKKEKPSEGDDTKKKMKPWVWVVIIVLGLGLIVLVPYIIAWLSLSGIF